MRPCPRPRCSASPAAAGPRCSARSTSARAGAAAELLGIGDEVFERTLDYLKQRRQFGRLIGEFQALQHRMAVLYIDLELARAALARALHALDAAPAQAAEAVAVAKAKCGRAATLAAQEGVQMHGGMGMTDQLDFGLFMQRARVLDELWATPAARWTGWRGCGVRLVQCSTLCST